MNVDVVVKGGAVKMEEAGTAYLFLAAGKQWCP